MPVRVISRGSTQSALCVSPDRVPIVRGHDCTSAGSSCSQVQGGTRYNCPQSAMVSMGLAQSASGGGTSTSGGGTTPLPTHGGGGKFGGGSGNGQQIYNNAKNAVNQGVNQGAADMGLAPPQNGESSPQSWISQYWPWLLVGGVAVTGVILVALAAGGEEYPALPPARRP